MCPVEMPPESWSDWAVLQLEIPATIAAYPRFRPDCFAQSVPDDPMMPYCTPRSLHQAGRLVKQGCADLELLAGWISEAVAADFLLYAKHVHELPSLEALLQDPTLLDKRANKDPGLLHAISIMAAQAVERAPEEMLRLADHMGAGWAIATVSRATNVWPEFKKSAAFRKWAVAHQDLLG